MNSILRKASKMDFSDAKRESYNIYSLTNNPFPDTPSLIINNEDKRKNGTIYNASLHENQRSSFDKFFFPKEVDPKTLVFLMDHATKRGRGIGKTVFLSKQVERIMKDLGGEITGGKEIVFAVHITPMTSPACRKFWQFSKMILEALNERDILSIGVCRLRVFTELIPQDITNEINSVSDLISSIGDDEYLEKHGVDIWKLNANVKRMLLNAGVREDFAHNISKYGYSPDKFEQNVLHPFTDFKWRQDGGKVLFEDFTNFFIAAGFNRGLILVDELEKIIPGQNLQERRTFVESIRYFFIDGDVTNSRKRFFNMLLTIHPGIQELLLPHWNSAGLDRLAPVNEPDAQRNTIYFPPLRVEDAKPLVVEYLKNFRTENYQKEDLFPFDSDSISETLIKSGAVPGKMLTLLNEIIEKAVTEKVDMITKAFVDKTYMQKGAFEEKPERDETETPASQTTLLG